MEEHEQKKKYVIVGSGKLAVKIAEYLSAQGLHPFVYEKRIAAVSSVEKSCIRKGIPYSCMTSPEMTAQFMQDLSQFQVRVFSAINTYIFPKQVLEHPNFWGINYHNALLPFHKGMNAEAWSIYDMDHATGITWHRIRPAIDEGEILIQKTIALDETINSLKLLKKQSDLAYEAFLEIAPKLFSDADNWQGTRQPTAKTAMHKIKDIPNNGYLSKKWDFQKTSAFLRAMDYGKLNTLKKPHIRFHSNEYEWERYQLKESPKAEQDSVELESNNIIISKKGSTNQIVLINVQRSDHIA